MGKNLQIYRFRENNTPYEKQLGVPDKEHDNGSQHGKTSKSVD